MNLFNYMRNNCSFFDTVLFRGISEEEEVK